jgi:hypothetical protein
MNPKDGPSLMTFNLSSPAQTIKELDDIIDIIRDETGMKLKRSGMIRALILCVNESKKNIETKNIYDENSLKIALKNAITKT